MNLNSPIVTLANAEFTVQINPKGAELLSFYDLKNKFEYIWEGDPSYWSKRSPILFPVIGLLKNDTFLHMGRQYKLAKHGFARELNFCVESVSENEAIFSLTSNSQTRKQYPFDFILCVHYRLLNTGLSLTYVVTNPSQEQIFFSIGGHPAINVPYVPATQFEDYYLEFDQEERAGIEITRNGLITNRSKPFLNNEKIIEFKKGMFREDALIFKNLKSGSIQLLNKKTGNSLKFIFKDFPYFALWSAPDAPFICFEPWEGLPDTINHDQVLEKKPGIVKLKAHEQWKKHWKIEVS